MRLLQPVSHLQNKFASKIRIRKTVQYLTAQNFESFGLFSGLDRNQRHYKAIQVVWICLVGISLCTCIFQIQKRIEYFLSEPVVVDAYNEMLTKGDFPTLTLRSVDTKAAKKLRTLTSGKILKFSEAVRVLNASAEELWLAMNTSVVIEDAYYFKGDSRFSDAVWKAEINPIGTVVNIFNDAPLPLGDSSLALRVVFKYPIYLNQYMQVKERSLIDAPTERYTRLIGKIQSMSVAIERYMFKNRNVYKCKEIKAYETCTHACHQKIFVGLLNCSLPFMTSPASLTWPKCWLSENTGEMIMLIYQAYVSSDLNCHECQERCDVTLLHFSNDFSDIVSDELRISLQSNVVRKMCERFAYDFISLLCDVGGNLGLFLGMSCLSLVEIVAGCVLWLSYKRKLAESTKDVVFRKVFKILKAQNDQKQLNKAGVDKKQNYFMLGTIIIATCLCFYQAYDRVAYYFSYPTNTEIELVKEKHSISLVSCIGSEKMLTLTDAYAKRRNISIDNVALLDLLDQPSNFANVNDLWVASSDLQEHTAPQEYRYALPAGYVESPFVAPFGNCTTVTEAVVIMLKAFENCKYKNFFIPPDRTIDFKNYIELACGYINAVTFKTQELERLSTPSKPCVTSEEADKCEQNCYRTKLFAKGITCGLPYMTFLDLSPCDSTESAKRSHSAYLDAFMNTDATKQCACKRRCDETLLLPSLSEVSVSPRTWLNLVQYSQKGEHKEVIKQTFSFPLEKLLCDIGSSLGTILGVSLLSLFQLLQSSVQVLKCVRELVFRVPI